MKHLRAWSREAGTTVALCGAPATEINLTGDTDTVGVCTECRRLDARRREPATAPERGDGECVISVTTGSETRTISVSSVREAIAALERRS